MSGIGNQGRLAFSYIRMSTDTQLKGHSKQRQLEKSAAYAKVHGLELADELQLEDIGVSAFKGDNVKEGALGRFLHAVEKGRVPAGSYLLVESLDRISRQEVLKSLSLFLRIIDLGIKLVTLQDNRIYHAQNVDLPELTYSLMIMSRAHEELQVKSDRVGAAWANKRSQAKSRKLTKWCPGWLRLSDDRSRYEIIPARIAVVRSIFADTVAGIGGYVITKRLNEKRVQSFGRAKTWQNSYVAKILSNPAVIGEFQPCKTTPDGKRQPAGEPIANYFPPIIDRDLFYRAQQCRSERRVGGGGRKGKYVTNLFSGLATCAYCHSRMAFDNKGSPQKRGTFLVCDGAKRGLGCVTKGWRYQDFETSFLAFVEQVDLPSLVKDDDSKKKELDDAIQALQGRRLTLRDEMGKAYELIKLNQSLEFVAEKLGALQQRTDEVDAQIKEIEVQRLSLESTESEFYQSKDEIKSLIARLQTTGDNDDLYKLRSQAAARIKGLVGTLEVAPIGRAPKVARLIEQLNSMVEDVAEKAAIADVMRIDEDMRYFLVGFKNGDVLGVFPKKDNPLHFERRVVSKSLEFSGVKKKLFGVDVPNGTNRDRN